MLQLRARGSESRVTINTCYARVLARLGSIPVKPTTNTKTILFNECVCQLLLRMGLSWTVHLVRNWALRRQPNSHLHGPRRRSISLPYVLLCRKINCSRPVHTRVGDKVSGVVAATFPPLHSLLPPSLAPKPQEYHLAHRHGRCKLPFSLDVLLLVR